MAENEDIRDTRLDQKVIKLRLLRVVVDDGVMADWRSALGGKATVSLLSDCDLSFPYAIPATDLVLVHH